MTASPRSENAGYVPLDDYGPTKDAWNNKIIGRNFSGVVPKDRCAHPRGRVHHLHPSL